MLLEERFFNQKAWKLHCLSIGELINKGTKNQRKEAKNPDNFCLTLSCKGLCGNTSKWHWVRDLSRCTGLFSQSPWRCEKCAGAGHSWIYWRLYSCKGICHPGALPLHNVKWGQSLVRRRGLRHLAVWVCIPVISEITGNSFPSIWSLEGPLRNWVSVQPLLLGEGASRPTGTCNCLCGGSRALFLLAYF